MSSQSIQQPAVSFAWRPIEDLPENWQKLAEPELAALGKIWAQQNEKLGQSKVLKEFNARLQRQWAIETGIIERIYDIDRGTTEILIERGIQEALIPHGSTDRPAAEIVRILSDHQEAVEGIFDFVKANRPLTTSFIEQLHQVLTRHQEAADAVDQFGQRFQANLLQGEWKRWPNNPTRPNGRRHEYCPPEQVASEIERLVQFYAAHQSVPPELEAAWLHHRFTQIHPFQDGNGRVARCLATMVLLKAGWFPLVITRDHRERYIDALEQADRGDLNVLIALFAQIEKDAFLRALSLSSDVLERQTSVRTLIDHAVSRILQRSQESEKENQVVLKLADQLVDFAWKELEAVKKQLNEALTATNLAWMAKTARSQVDSEHWYHWQIGLIAQKFGYRANLHSSKRWLRLRIESGLQFDLVFSFHRIGEEIAGLMACTAFISIKSPDEEGASLEHVKPVEALTTAVPTQTYVMTTPSPACSEPFTFASTMAVAPTIAAFHKWLEKSLTIGLEEWRRRV
ncbi:Fic family protein [candidate division KSB1 bacterium]|nr:Fic family protein [candidate division KSB1 bacterium]